MRIAITGVSGLIGTALTERLEAGGHTVLGVSRRPGPGRVGWDPGAGALDESALAGVDGVVHLAGEPIEGRWTAGKKRRIVESRTKGTQLIAQTMARLDPRPSVLVSSSAIGFYGDRGTEVLTEASPPGSGFLPEVCVAWEEATTPASDAGIRVAHARTGIVLAADGGALAKLSRLFKAFVGGRLGSGRQIWSWIAIEDEVAALEHLLTAEIEGPVNLTAPHPVSNADFTEVLADVLGRPAVLPAPAVALKAVLGEMGEALLLASADARPAVLEESGFRFGLPDLRGALAAILRPRR